jgi:hypothetical protein
MSEAAVLKIIVVGQTGFFLLVVLLLWHQLDGLREGLLRLRKQVERQARQVDV